MHCIAYGTDADEQSEADDQSDVAVELERYVDREAWSLLKAVPDWRWLEVPAQQKMVHEIQSRILAVGGEDRFNEHMDQCGRSDLVIAMIH